MEQKPAGIVGRIGLIIGTMLSMLVLTTAGAFAVTEIFDTPGTTTWTVPAGVTSITVEAWGGGGAGGAALLQGEVLIMREAAPAAVGARMPPRHLR